MHSPLPSSVFSLHAHTDTPLFHTFFGLRFLPPLVNDNIRFGLPLRLLPLLTYHPTIGLFVALSSCQCLGQCLSLSGFYIYSFNLLVQCLCLRLDCSLGITHCMLICLLPGPQIHFLHICWRTSAYNLLTHSPATRQTYLSCGDHFFLLHVPHVQPLPLPALPTFPNYHSFLTTNLSLFLLYGGLIHAHSTSLTV